MNRPVDPNDPNTWPIADAVPTDVFLGSSTHDCTPDLTEEQKAWPVADCEPADIILQPSLLVELTVRPDAGGEEVALGMAELLAALSAREESLGGTGLLFDKRGSRREKGRVLVVLYPKREVGAQQRLRELAALIERGESPIVPMTVVGERGSFVQCHAIAA